MTSFVLRGTDFGSVVASSIFEPLSRNWRGELSKLLFPKEWETLTAVTRGVSYLPNNDWGDFRVVKSMFRNYALVSRRLGNSGIGVEYKNWIPRRESFFISFISVNSVSLERVYEFRQFIRFLRKVKKLLNAPTGLLIDTTIHHDLQLYRHDELLCELFQMMDLAVSLQMPVMPHLSLTVPVYIAEQVAKHPVCDALSISSGIPWGGCPDRIAWEKLFGSFDSPLAAYGCGELYGQPCLPVLKDWVKSAKS